MQYTYIAEISLKAFLIPCLIAKYLLFRRSRRHFIPRCVNSHPRFAAFICSGKYSQVPRLPPRSLFSRVPRSISETRPLCKYSFSRLRRCGERCGKTFASACMPGRMYSQVRIIDTSHVAPATSMGNPGSKAGIDRLVRRNRFASRYAAVLLTAK